MRRIGLTSLNPMVCLSSQSESDPKMKKAIRSEKMFIKSDPMLKFVIRNPIRSELKLLYIQRALIIRCMNVFFHDHKRYIGNNEFPAKISRYESDKNCSAISHNYALYSYTSVEKNPTSHVVIITMHDLELGLQFKTS